MMLHILEKKRAGERGNETKPEVLGGGTGARPSGGVDGVWGKDQTERNRGAQQGGG